MNSRRLAALMFTDMVGYSAIAHKNEILARDLVSDQRGIVREALDRHGGREHDTAGDGFFIEFSSAVSALECAVEIQSRLYDRNRFAAPERKIQIRVGIHLGDVVAEDRDLFGNGVNLAARIEPLAPAGGICITQQVYDQVLGKIEGLSFKKQGHRKLKNIASGAVVYSVVTPWNRVAESKMSQMRTRLSHLPFFENMSSVVGGVLFAACALCLMTATYSSFSFQDSTIANRDRAPAAALEGRTDLSTHWYYQVAKTQTTPAWEQTPDETAWKDFDPKNSWKYSEVLRGKYFLKRTLEGGTHFETPAIVLGLIPDSHRVFLNGHFIGGADQSGDLALYAFDRKILHDQDNTLLVAGEERPSLNPGLTTLGGVGTFLGDFTEARRAVAKNQLQFGLLRNIYFAFSLFIFAVAFAYALFRRSSRAYFYFAFVLLLDSIQLAYFNPALTMAFNYPFLRFLKAIGLSLTPLILFSSYLAGEGKRRAEFAVNSLAAIFAVGIALAFFEFSPTTNAFSDHFNDVLLAALGATTVIFVILAKQALQFKKLPLHVFYVAFEIVSAISIMASLKRGLSTLLLPSGVRDSVFGLTLASPVVFAIAVMIFAVVDHIRQTHLAKNQKARDELALDVLHSIHEAKGSRQAVFEIHKKLASFVGATRSTVYLVDHANSADLEVFHSLGDQFANGRVASTEVRAHKVLHHVLSTNTPVLVRDIRNDLRFHDRQSAQESSSYVTGSCMVIPLRTLGKITGVVTFADKANQTPFNETDFSSAIELASTLTLLISNANAAPVGVREFAVV